jgi:carbon-monoxide dehydrogenase medium subunit
MAWVDHPASVDEAVRLLRQPDARPIGGGVGILLAARLGRPIAGRFVALGRLPGLRAIELEPVTGDLVVGAAVTLAELAASPVASAHAPVLHAAARAAASTAIRTIGTVAGNLVDAPAASDLMAAAMAVDAGLALRDASGARSISMHTLSVRPPIVGPGTLVTALRIPPPGGVVGWSLQRLQTQGLGDRPAIVVALRIVVADGRIGRLSGAATFLGDRPLVLAGLGMVATDGSIDDAAGGKLDAAVAEAALTDLERARSAGAVVADDLRASAEYRRAVLPVLAARAVREAAANVGR